MAEIGAATVKVKFDIEPTETAKECVRKMVMETMRDLLIESTWLQELLTQRVKELSANGS